MVVVVPVVPVVVPDVVSVVVLVVEGIPVVAPVVLPVVVGVFPGVVGIVVPVVVPVVVGVVPVVVAVVVSVMVPIVVGEVPVVVAVVVPVVVPVVVVPVVVVVVVPAVALVVVVVVQVAALYAGGIMTIACCSATAVCAYMRPVKLAPVTRVTSVFARMMPWKSAAAPIDTVSATAQKTRLARRPPVRVTWVPAVCVRVPLYVAEWVNDSMQVNEVLTRSEKHRYRHKYLSR